jgi:hypothetical protein
MFHYFQKLIRKSKDVTTVKITDNCPLSRWFRQYWLKHFTGLDEVPTIKMNEKMYKLIHFLLITGEEEIQGFVSCIHQQKYLLEHQEHIAAVKMAIKPGYFNMCSDFTYSEIL